MAMKTIRSRSTAAAAALFALALAGVQPARAEELAEINGKILVHYGEMHSALAGDSIDGVKSAAAYGVG